MKYSQKTLHSSPERARYGVSFVSHMCCSWSTTQKVERNDVIPLGLDVIAHCMGIFIHQIWKYLIYTSTFSCFLLMIIVLYAHANMTLLWSITPPWNIGETCQICNKKVQSFSYNIECSNCLVKYHTKCINENSSEVFCELWYCPYCVQAIFPYNHFDDDDDFYSAVIEGMLDCPFRLHEINSKVFTPFEINDSFDTPFSEIDPDYQYYTNLHQNGNLNCDYYYEDKFRCKLHKTDESRLSLFHLNIKSISKHYDELELYLKSLEFKFSFIGLTETWLDVDKEEFYDLNGYTSVNRYRKDKKGGGVSLHVLQGITFTLRNDLDYFDSEMETVFIELDKSVFNTDSNIVIGVIYRMPNSSVDVFNDRISDILNVLQRERKLCYLLGDLNIDLLKAEDHKATGELLDVLYCCNVFPLITKPTRVTGTTATLIDHILTNNLDNDMRHIQGILCTSISDHYAVFHVAGNAKTDHAQTGIPVLIRNMGQRNIAKFISEMNMIDWQFVLNETDTAMAYSKFHEAISLKYNACFPYRKISKKYYKNKPWLSTALKESIKIKNKLYVKSKRSGNSEKVSYYKKYRNKLNQLIRSAERKHFHDVLLEHKSNLKKSWQVIKTVINKRKYTPVNTKFKVNGATTNDGNVIANKFNSFFVNVGTVLAKSISPTDKNPVDYIQQDMISNLYFDPVTEQEIYKIIDTFKDSAAGWDDLKSTMIKHIKESITTPLVHICNRSFETGIFPSELKIANVVPIYKSGDEMVFSNYRPVSVLPVFSKLLERLVYNRLISHINENKLLYEYQFGFQKGKSTYLAVMMLVDKITEALDQGECVVGVFLDFSKAFDTVDHNILLQKLHKYGICGVELLWFEDYLSNRMQYVTYNNHKSSREKINCGVPQGSILGPILFLLYINDLASVSEFCFSVLFADDTNMFITGKDMNVLCRQLNEDLRNIQEWLQCNKLSLNVLKTHYMIFTPKNKVIDDIEVKIHDVQIQRVYTTKFLGVQIDSKLTWKMHIEYTCKKLSKCVGILCKARKKLYKSTLISLYYSFAYPYFIYCNHVWGTNYPSCLERIYLIQKKLIRIITCSPFRAHTGPLYFANKILNVYDINDYIIGSFMYECLYGTIPEIFRNYFQRNADVHDHNLRNVNDLYVPYGRLDIRKFSIKIAGANLWNSLPSFVKNSQSNHIFKKNMRHYLVEKKRYT